MDIKAFFDPATYTLTYVVSDPATKDAVIIDPVLDYDPAASATDTHSVEEVIRFVRDQGLQVHFILETHAHADHLSSSQRLKAEFPHAILAIGSRITQVQALFKGLFNLPAGFPADGSQFDRLLEDEEQVQAGSLSFKVMHAPGHTPADAVYLFGDALFTGDVMFMPDFGTGRCDFPGGSAEAMYDSITHLYEALPDDTRVFVGHDYQPGGRDLAYETTIGEEKQSNVQLPAGRNREEFIRFRTERDRTLSAPRLLLPSVQINIGAGRLPEAAPNGIRYLSIPINLSQPEASDDAVSVPHQGQLVCRPPVWTAPVCKPIRRVSRFNGPPCPPSLPTVAAKTVTVRAGGLFSAEHALRQGRFRGHLGNRSYRRSRRIQWAARLRGGSPF
jgi:glyoxylase-like metal-dependent hydrolase (beta-lactamase superfamily II)